MVPVQTAAPIEICVARSRGAMRALQPDPGIGAFFRYAPTSALRTLRTMEEVVEKGGTAFVACRGPIAVGYLVLARPGADQPWGEDPRRVRTVSVEVARGWRGQGLARRLFDALQAEPAVDHLILVATAYCWCWDVGHGSRTGADEWTYSRRLFELFASAGFRRRGTNELNVTMDPRNFLAVRVGARVSAEDVRRFEATLFAPRGCAAAHNDSQGGAP